MRTGLKHCIHDNVLPFLNLRHLVNFMFLQLSGYKKVLNYTKKVAEEIRYRTALSREEVMFECL